MARQLHKTPKLVSMLLVLLAVMSGCSSNKSQLQNHSRANLPNLYFEQAITAEKATANQSKIPAVTAEIADCQSQPNKPARPQWTKSLRQLDFADTSKPQVNPTTPSSTAKNNNTNNGRTGESTAQFGLFVNALIFVCGIVLATTVGFGWGSSVGLFWILFLLFSMLLLPIGLITSLGAYFKMKRKKVDRSILRISLYSLIAFLGSILIWAIQFNSN